MSYLGMTFHTKSTQTTLPGYPSSYTPREITALWSPLFQVMVRFFGAQHFPWFDIQVFGHSSPSHQGFKKKQCIIEKRTSIKLPPTRQCPFKLRCPPQKKRSDQAPHPPRSAAFRPATCPGRCVPGRCRPAATWQGRRMPSHFPTQKSRGRGW